MCRFSGPSGPERGRKIVKRKGPRQICWLAAAGGRVSSLRPLTAREPSARTCQDVELQIEVLPPGGDHVHDVEAAGGKDFFEADGARRGPAAAAAGHADPGSTFSREAFLARHMSGDPSQVIEEGTYALAQVAKVYRGGEDGRLAISNRLHNAREIVFDDASALGAAWAPARLVALAAEVDPRGEGGEGDVDGQDRLPLDGDGVDEVAAARTAAAAVVVVGGQLVDLALDGGEVVEELDRLRPEAVLAGLVRGLDLAGVVAGAGLDRRPGVV